jgi:thiamine phosphate synthase YjbQ (UPF0047 family)
VRRNEPAQDPLPLVAVDHVLTTLASQPGPLDVTAQIASWIGTLNAREGLLMLTLREGSASLVIAEQAPIEADGMNPAAPAVLAADVSLSIPIADGRMALGKSQSILILERRHSGTRRLALHFVGALNGAKPGPLP